MREAEREGELGLVVPCSLWRFLMIPAPFYAAVALLLVLDREGIQDSLPAILRNVGLFALLMLGLGLVCCVRVSLVLDRSGLTIHYPLHSRAYRWDQLYGFRVERKSLFLVKTADLIRFGVVGQRDGSVLATFGPSARQLVATFERWQRGEGREADGVD